MVADTILQQLGGNMFMVMTGVKNLIADGNTLRMKLPKNASIANNLWITLLPDDTYQMRFFKYTNGRINKKLEWIEPKETDIKVVDGVYWFELQNIFTEVTGMYVRL